MKVVINLELDYVLDRDVLFFLSNEKLVTKCIKTMSVKKDKTDKINENNFDIIMNKGLSSPDNYIDESANTTENDENNDLYIK